MEKLIHEMNWLKAEESRLFERYMDESNEAKSKILLFKTVEISSMVSDIKYKINKLERGRA